jgi:glycosyltransferase involved in cell wall biosynthesis
MKISIVIPCHKPYIIYLDKIIDDVSKQTYKPIECILSISEINENIANELKNKYFDKLNKVNINFIIVWDSKRRNAGPNRNSGADAANGEYISFIDADDSISPFRLEVINYFLETKKPNLLIHGFFNNKRDEYPNVDLTNIKLIENDTIKNLTYPDGYKRNREREILQIKKPMLKIPTDTYHHGAVTVKKEIFKTIRYTTAIRGQDSLFCRDILEQIGGLIYINEKLMSYET